MCYLFLSFHVAKFYKEFTIINTLILFINILQPRICDVVFQLWILCLSWLSFHISGHVTTIVRHRWNVTIRNDFVVLFIFFGVGSHSLIKSTYQSLKEFSQSSSLFICLSLSIFLFSSSISLVLVYGFKLPFPPANTNRSAYLLMFIFYNI